jgi:5-methylcytosine-specific restriction enzyme B
MPRDASLQTFLSDYDFEAAEQVRRTAEEERIEFVRQFPLDEWPDMSLERYAQGHSTGPDSFVTGLQTKTKRVAAVFLGNAVNGLIYYSKKNEQWISFWDGLSPDEAWLRARSAWVRALKLASESQWHAIDELDDLKPAKSLVLKALYLYFPDELLPVNSENHMRKFIRALGRNVDPGVHFVSLNVDPGVHFVSLNRELLTTARSVPEFESARSARSPGLARECRRSH